jgi:RNA polymerase sigma-70 factor (ECF subfamily)
VAESKVFGPTHALALLDDVDAEGWHLYWSTRSELHRQAGEITRARADLVAALECPMNESDRQLLQERLAGL